MTLCTSKKVVNEAKSGCVNLIDANAYHSQWSNTYNNIRGRAGVGKYDF